MSTDRISLGPVVILPDGSIERTDPFAATDDAARAFWEAVERQRPDSWPRAHAKHAETRDALFMAAAHLQGHSDAGRTAAKVLGVPHPLRMTHLEAKAIAEGRDPGKLWPWYASPRTARSA